MQLLKRAPVLRVCCVLFSALNGFRCLESGEDRRNPSESSDLLAGHLNHRCGIFQRHLLVSPALRNGTWPPHTSQGLRLCDGIRLCLLLSLAGLVLKWLLQAKESRFDLPPRSTGHSGPSSYSGSGGNLYHPSAADLRHGLGKCRRSDPYTSIYPIVDSVESFGMDQAALMCRVPVEGDLSGSRTFT